MRGTMKPGHDQSVYLASVFNLASLVMSISGCKVVSYSLTYHSRELHPSAPQLGSNVHNKAAVILNLGLSGRVAALIVPGMPLSAYVSSGCFAGVAIDPLYPPLNALLSALEQEPWSDPFATPFTDFCSGVRLFEV